MVDPTHEQTAALQALQAAIERDASRAGVPGDAARRITLQEVPPPPAYAGFVKSIEKLFGARIQFVRSQGLPQEIGFNGLYQGGRNYPLQQFPGLWDWIAQSARRDSCLIGVVSEFGKIVRFRFLCSSQVGSPGYFSTHSTSRSTFKMALLEADSFKAGNDATSAADLMLTWVTRLIKSMM